MKRKFTSSLLLLLSLNLIVKPFWIFGIDRTVQNTLGSGEYGMFFALFNLSMLLNIILDFGLTSYNNREISQHPQILSRYFSNMVVVKLVLALAYLLVCFAVATFLGYHERQLWILFVLCFNQFLSSFILYLRSNVSALQHFKTDSILSVTDRFLMILLCGILLWTPLRSHFKIEWFVYSQTLAYLLTAALAFILILRKTDFFSPKFEKAIFISIIRQSYPFAILALLMSFHYRVDGIMLERMLPDGHIQSGVYAQAFRLLDASTMVPFLFATLLLPIFSRMLSSNESVIPILKLAFCLLFCLSVTFSIACIAHRDNIISLLYVNNTNDSSLVFAILMLSFVFISISYILGTLLTANGNLKYLNFFALAGGVINFTLNLILIPQYQVVGAAVSSFITQAFIATSQIIIAKRIFKITFSKPTIYRFIGFGFVNIAVIFITLLFQANWFINFMLMCLIGVGAAISLGLIRVKEIVLLYTKAD